MSTKREALRILASLPQETPLGAFFDRATGELGEVFTVAQMRVWVWQDDVEPAEALRSARFASWLLLTGGGDAA